MILSLLIELTNYLSPGLFSWQLRENGKIHLFYDVAAGGSGGPDELSQGGNSFGWSDPIVVVTYQSMWP